MIAKEFYDYLISETRCSPQDGFVITVSGGIDSVVMLNLFHKNGCKGVVAHCNFHLRGDESDGDEAFVKALAEKYGFPFEKIDFDTKGFVKDNKVSVQMAARELRYKWFETIRKKYGFPHIAIAHNKNDLAETFLLNIVRGTGIKGLTGIKAVNKKIVRPLLFASRNQILQYCENQELDYREDSSNQSVKYSRNRIRHAVFPEMEKINPSIIQTISENAERLADVFELFNDSVGGILKEIVYTDNNAKYLNIPKLWQKKGVHAILFEFLSPYHFSPEMVRDIMLATKGQSGKQFFSVTHRLLKDRDKLILTPIEQNVEPAYELEVVHGDVSFNKDKADAFSLKLEIIENTAKISIIKDPRYAYIDLDKVESPMLLRKWKHGDVFYPLGMNNKKKLSDFFIDKKFSVSDKENVWLLESSNCIVWIVGCRLDNRFKISSSTKRILRIKLT